MDAKAKINRLLHDLNEKEKYYKKEVERWKAHGENKGVVCIWGAGGVGARCCNYLEKLGIKTNFFVDRDEKVVKAGEKSQQKVPLYLPNILDKQNTENIICFAAVGDIKRLLPQLESYNFKEIVYVNDSSYTLDFHLEAACLLVAEDRQTLVSSILEAVSLLSDEKSLEILWRHLNVCFGNGTGDDDLILPMFQDIADTNQYFLCEDTLPESARIIVDCGAYIGDTLKVLIEKLKFDRFEKYYAIEMDKEIYEHLYAYVRTLPLELQKKVICINKGVGDAENTIKYIPRASGGSMISSNGYEKQEITAIDIEFVDHMYTFLKMDIEGAEKAAIAGASKTIKAYTPQCAICVYHYIKDLWEIPILLKKLVPDYQFIFRHYSEGWPETVCYASNGGTKIL